MKLSPRKICAAALILLATSLGPRTPLQAQTSNLPGEQIPETRERYLTETEVAAWPDTKVRYAINEMFARHGAPFDKGDLRKTFSVLPWYKPRDKATFDEIEAEFSDIEKENLKLLAYFRDARAGSRKATSRTKSEQNPSASKPRPSPQNPVANFFTRLAQNVTAGLENKSQRSTPIPQLTGTIKKVSPEAGSIPTVTSGSERFVIKGLRIGANPVAVSAFLTENQLRPSGAPHMLQIDGKVSRQQLPYLESQEYSNGKTGTAELTVTLDFTPPLPTPEGTAALVYAIHYKAHYGEGVSKDEIMLDLRRKYGQPDSVDFITTASWRVPGTNADCALQVYVRPPREVGSPGELELWAFDQPFAWRAREWAQKNLDKLDAERPKDKTKPDF